MDYEEYKEDENGELTITNAKKMKNLQVDVLPCVIHECDGKEVSLNGWFNMYRRQKDGTATSMFRGRPLQGKTYKDTNFYLMKEDKLNEDALKATAKVTEFTNWVVQPLVEDRMTAFVEQVPALMAALHET
ncbi:Oidioi.mRNA.OKI2018_I69.chr2.g6944.t1.cds [Oikopleura dioica]|uniref:Oidioi.mRNA.OKI2018_I69.chr2.g6944.t1.cds n=1 Tax=Oikopleura dioica TaxID=34765 RepID=A0ABN7TDT5_OIKDI|nr:Oidioi.mRNA.OKI2018_I69.chr2.g6944.t1.cds [Oikopleura dioica]